MSEKIIFEKTYTRDTCIILQQAWNEALNNIFEVKLGIKNPHKPQILYYFNNGVIELWSNKKSINWITEALLKNNIENPSLVLSIIKDYEEQLKKFESCWQKGGAKSKDELKIFLDLLFSEMVGYVAMYYTSINDDTPKELKNVADEVREADKFFDENDKFIRNSLKSIYPELSEYVTSITIKEFMNSPHFEELEKRNKGAILVSDNFELLSLEDYAKLHNELLFKDLESSLDTSELKGSVAFKGIVKGIVKIVRRKDEVGLVKEGEIIVSPMTTPDYVPAMKIAGAFVTDEGGIMCHAAIIARELKKPCIIGTKIATKVLKDGMMVEVDANNGVVKIINTN